jgi:hypothetical protein
MTRNQKDFTFDASLQLKDAGAVTASGAATVAAVGKVLNLGAARVDARVIVDVAAITDGVGDESYRIRIQGSNSPTFAASIQELAAFELGAAALTGDSVADVLGRREIAFTNEVNGVTYQYLRAYHQIAGAAPSIDYHAFVVQQF